MCDISSKRKQKKLFVNSEASEKSNRKELFLGERISWRFSNKIYVETQKRDQDIVLFAWFLVIHEISLEAEENWKLACSQQLRNRFKLDWKNTSLRSAENIDSPRIFFPQCQKDEANYAITTGRWVEKRIVFTSIDTQKAPRGFRTFILCVCHGISIGRLFSLFCKYLAMIHVHLNPKFLFPE